MHSASFLCQNKTRMKMTEREIFKFTNYDCIGFDLDNTIARYKVGSMIEMEYKLLSNFLVNKKGYSKQHLLKPIDHNFIIKGLILDIENGNLLRISPEGTILQVAHGTTFLKQEEIERYYPNFRWKATDLFIQDPLQTYDEIRIILDYFDIIISLVFARAVDWIHEGKTKLKIHNICPDILDALEDERKYWSEMKACPDKYYYKCSDKLLSWLTQLKQAGKIMFLLTSSDIYFASYTATHTLGPNWRQYFDIVIAVAKKPGFFTLRRNFIGLDSEPVKLYDLKLGGIYSQGNWTDLKEFIKIHSKVSNPKFLYVGDHLIQDIHPANVHAECDTVTICEELEAEGAHGHKKSHPDEQILCSTIWGSYFTFKDSGKPTNWYNMMKSHSKLVVPSLEYVAKFPLDNEFTTL